MQKIRYHMGRMRIRTLIYTLVSVLVICFVVLEVMYLMNLRAVNRENTRQYLQLSLVQLSETVTTFHNHMEQIGRELAYNSAANSFVSSTNAVEWYVNHVPLLAVISSAQIADRNLERIIYSDLNMLNIGTRSAEDFQYLTPLVDEIKSGALYVDLPRHVQVDGKSLYVRKSGYNKVLDRQFYLIIRYANTNFENAITVVDGSEGQLFALYNDQNQVLAINEPDLGKHEYLSETIAGYREDGSYYDSGYVIAVRNIPEIGWRWVTAAPDGSVNEQFIRFSQFSLLLTVALMLLLLFVAALIQQSITQPILYVNKFMSEIREDYDSRRLQLVQNNEIGELADKLNDMLAKIGSMNREMIRAQQQIYESQLDKQHMELSALYSQINPHFLYNTLDCIRSIAAVNHVEPIVKMTSSMVKIFRYSIKSRSFVRVREELACIYEYMLILQTRYQGGFTEVYHIDEACLDLVIPKMIMQPVVENAVFHGLEQSRKQGTLQITGSIEGDKLQFEISDDGRGMDAEMLRMLQESLHNQEIMLDNTLRDKKSIGLRNIHARIRLLCGNEYGMHVDSSPDQGTRVLLTLPILHAEDIKDYRDP